MYELMETERAQLMGLCHPPSGGPFLFS
ncbi:rCG22383 [Rattus norvegicus]|uniref:RCG22383 n=1 Tax=Rattus norvegicus TaxID=10116 RepID=A6INR6_RAT|nr:rCG22383 [Rattus norvegicus]